ncbi:MAG TPA: TadE/TadG family type IV pilus assembly protein [Caulobacteraceae bacterium]
MVRRRVLRRIRRDQRGAAAVEFALLAPIMIVIYFGLVETCEAVLAERKADHVASAIGDLVAQSTGVSASDITDIFSIGNTIMSPFATSTLQMRVTSLSLNTAGNPAVTWSYGAGGMAALSAGTAKTLPITITAGDSVIMSEVKYQYDSPLKYVVPNALTYNEVYYLRPRQVSQISCTGC